MSVRTVLPPSGKIPAGAHAAGVRDGGRWAVTLGGRLPWVGGYPGWAVTLAGA